MRDSADATRLSVDDLQTVDNVLADTPTPARTRRWILERAALGVAAAAALDPVATAIAAPRRHGSDSLRTIGTDAVTAEALAVTFISEVVRRLPGTPLASSAEELKAIDAAELDHFRFLRKAGFRPLTQRFWIPDALFGPNLSNVAASIEAADTLFVNAYLIAITAFARAGRATLARAAGEIAGVESEHRALARSLQGKLPNNVGFEGFRFHHIAQIVKALEGAGIGFGKQGAKPGRFFDFHVPSSDLLVTLEHNRPA